METKPLIKYKTPNYPRIEVVLSEPNLLIKNMPKTWRKNKLIVTAMISFSLSACKGQTNDTIKSDNNIEILDINRDKQDTILNKQDSARVAPIFVHGDGVGASGCVMIAPPVYLSEEDALKIILGELKKNGILFNDTFTGDSIEVKRNKVVYNNDKKITNWSDRYSDTTETKKLYPDAYNKDLNMVIEFVSFDDYREYGDEERNFSSVSEYYIKAAAEKIQKAFKDNGKYNTIVFYDPVGWADRNETNWDKMEKKGREKAIKMLKEQVSDFIEWLKNESLILKN